MRANALAEVETQDRLARLAEHLFLSTGVDGVYARTGAYESVVEALAGLISRHRPPGAEVLRFPPVMSRRHLERHGYLKSFPHLLGCVSCLAGSEAEIRSAVEDAEAGERWAQRLEAADVVLAPAACYPVYPIAAARGPVPEGGAVFDVACDCFRREPSREIDRMQSFRMREFVCLASADEVQDFRRGWIERGRGIAADLGLPARVELASDPFFGRGAPLVAMSQMQQELKFELLTPIRSEGSPTACMSFNYHQDHFGEAWSLRMASGEVAHTACVAFGMDRLAVALFAAHGADVEGWPASVRERLRL